MTGHFGALSDHCEEDDGSGSSQWREKFIIIRRATEACYRMQRTKKGCFFLLDTLPWALDDVLAKNHGLLFCNKYVKTQCPNSFNSSPSETFGGPCMYTGYTRRPTCPRVHGRVHRPRRAYGQLRKSSILLTPVQICQDFWDTATTTSFLFRWAMVVLLLPLL